MDENDNPQSEVFIDNESGCININMDAQSDNNVMTLTKNGQMHKGRDGEPENNCSECNSDSCDITNTDSFDMLSKFPRSVTLNILELFSMHDLLHVVSLVSKEWRSKVFDPHLWTKIDMIGYVINDKVLKTLPTLCDFITDIMLPDDVKGEISDAGMIALAKGCPNLRTFYAPRCDCFSEAAFIAFAEHCKDLIELHLDNVDVSDRVLRSIANNLEKLEILTLIQSTSFTNEGLADVFRNCKRLYECRLRLNKDITGKCFEALSQSSKSIRRLDLRMCRIDPAYVTHLAVLSNLDYLNLTDCRTMRSLITLQDLYPVLKGCRNLSRLGLSLNKNIDDHCVDVILTHLPRMAYIFLISTAITDEALYTMAKKGNSLVHIDVGHTKVTEAGVRVVSENCPALTFFGLMTCKSLEEFHVDVLADEFPHIRYSTFLQDAKRLFEKDEIERNKLVSISQYQNGSQVTLHE